MMASISAHARACVATRKGGEGNVGGWHAGRGRLAKLSRTAVAEGGKLMHGIRFTNG